MTITQQMRIEASIQTDRSCNTVKPTPVGLLLAVDSHVLVPKVITASNHIRETPAELYAREALENLLPALPTTHVTPPRSVAEKKKCEDGVVDTRSTPAQFYVRSLLDLRRSVESKRKAAITMPLRQVRTEELARPRRTSVKARLDPLAVQSPAGLPSMLALIDTGTSKLLESEHSKKLVEDLTAAAERDTLATEAFCEVKVGDVRHYPPQRNKTVELSLARQVARRILRAPHPVDTQHISTEDEESNNENL